MDGYYHLSFNDLNKQAQNRLLQDAKNNLIEQYGEERLMQEARDIDVDYDIFIAEQIRKQIHSFDVIIDI